MIPRFSPSFNGSSTIVTNDAGHHHHTTGKPNSLKTMRRAISCPTADALSKIEQNGGGGKALFWFLSSKRDRGIVSRTGKKRLPRCSPTAATRRYHPLHFVREAEEGEAPPAVQPLSMCKSKDSWLDGCIHDDDADDYSTDEDDNDEELLGLSFVEEE